jgi:hypothetical protein
MVLVLCAKDLLFHNSAAPLLFPGCELRMLCALREGSSGLSEKRAREVKVPLKIHDALSCIWHPLSSREGAPNHNRMSDASISLLTLVVPSPPFPAGPNPRCHPPVGINHLPFYPRLRPEPYRPYQSLKLRGRGRGGAYSSSSSRQPGANGFWLHVQGHARQ